MTSDERIEIQRLLHRALGSLEAHRAGESHGKPSPKSLHHAKKFAEDAANRISEVIAGKK
jgi:hypothetical protein